MYGANETWRAVGAVWRLQGDKGRGGEKNEDNRMATIRRKEKRINERVEGAPHLWEGERLDRARGIHLQDLELSVLAGGYHIPDNGSRRGDQAFAGWAERGQIAFKARLGGWQRKTDTETDVMP